VGKLPGLEPKVLGHRDDAMSVAHQPAVLHTERLRLRPRTLDDVDANVAMDLDLQVHRYIFSQAPEPGRWRARIAAQITSGWPSTGGLWAVERQSEPGFLGWCGLFPLNHSGLIEIGYRYVRAAWGQGIGSEAARAVLDHGFRALALDPIVAVAHPDNRASQRVLEKIGLLGAGEAYYYGEWLRFYRLSRAEYLG
jgi:RimJ/RimL family protein N-acetyltransferase